MKRQQQGVGWGAGHACDSPPSDASLSAKRLYVSSCTSLLCGEVLTHGGLPVFISILDSRFSAGCGLQLLRCVVALVRWYVILQYVGYATPPVPSACPSTAFPSISLAEFSCPNSTQRTKIAHNTNTRRSKRKAQESKPSKPEQPPFPSTRRSSTAVQKPHSNPRIPTRIPNDKIVDTTN